MYNITKFRSHRNIRKLPDSELLDLKEIIYMKYKFLVIFLASLLIFVIPQTGFAKEQIELSSEQLLYTSDGLSGSGKVIFKHKSFLITCDSFYLARKENTITFSGNVTFSEDANRVKGDTAIYDLTSQALVITNAVTNQTTDFSSAPVFIRGEEISISESSIRAIIAKATTCDLEKPHYHIKADSVEIYQNEFVILRNASFYDGDLRLFAFPYFLIPLTDDTPFEFPKIGNNPYEGFFIKTTFAYYLSPSSHGVFLIDYLQKKGIGLGIHHISKLQSLSGFFKIYYILPIKSTDLNTTNHTNEQLKPSSASILLSGKIGKTTTLLNVNYKKSSSQPTSSSITGYMSLVHPLSDNTSLQFRSDRYAEYDKNQMVLSGYVKNTMWSLKATVTEPKSTSKVLDGYPELTIDIPEPSIGSYTLPANLSLSLGHMIEKPTTQNAIRGDVSLQFNTDTIRLKDKISINLNTNTRYTIYFGISQRFATEFGATLNTPITKWLSFTSTYVNKKVYGLSPFQSDQLLPEHTITNHVRFTAEKILLSINNKYDINKRIPGLIKSVVQYTMSSANYVSFSADYNPITSRFVSVSPGFLFNPGNQLIIEGNVSYNLINGKAEQNSLLMNIKAELPFGWIIEHNELKNRSMSESTTIITKDLHCRELRFYYEHTNQTFWFEYRIKALTAE
jgi:hypothetical protein